MKAILLLCLIASLNCNLVDTALCLFQNDKLKSIVSEVIDTLKTQNFNKLIEIVLSNFSDAKSMVLNCLNKETGDETEPILLDGTYKEITACRLACGKDRECFLRCLEIVCQSESIQEDVKEAEIN